MGGSRRKLAALASAGAVVAFVALPSEPALAKSDYGVTISGKQFKAGATVTVTVTLGDDGGIEEDTRMCLFQIVGDHAPRAHSTDGFPDYALPAGSRYVKVADCQRPAPNEPAYGSPDDYDSGETKYRLKVTSPGWLAFAAFREEITTPVDTGGPVLSEIVPVSSRGGAEAGAAAAKATFLSIEPTHRPADKPTTDVPGQAAPSTDLSTPDTTDLSSDDSEDLSSDEAAAEADRPRVRQVVSAAAGGLLLGVVLTSVTMILWSRARAKKR